VESAIEEIYQVINTLYTGKIMLKNAVLLMNNGLLADF
jgi:hypothetical protein